MKTAVSIPDKVFRSADSLAKHLGVSRSKLYSTALTEFLSQRHNLMVRERLDAVYGEKNSAPDPELVDIQVKSLLPEDW